MTDIEMTKTCAKAMGWHTGKPASKVVAYKVNDCAIIAGNDQGGESVYDPLHYDAQAMALVKKMELRLWKDPFDHHKRWHVCFFGARIGQVGDGIYRAPELNRAIVECVALGRVDSGAEK